MPANNYLLRETEGALESVKEWYNPSTRTIMLEGPFGYYDSIQLKPDESPREYLDVVKTQSRWCKVWKGIASNL